jgi:hypothetical protein
LTDEQASKLERCKFFMLCQLDPGQDVDEKVVAALCKNDLSIPEQVDALVKETVRQHTTKNGTAPTIDVMRRYQAGAYAFWKGEFESDEEWVDSE